MGMLKKSTIYVRFLSIHAYIVIKFKCYED